MKTFRTKSGPFIERPYYTVEEIEQTCINELQKVSLLPSSPEPIRIERFIEKRFKVHPVYDNLPEGILGMTEFGPEGVKAIIISKALTEGNNVVAERRVNTTLAHEAGHGLFHAHLFVLGIKPKSLFGDALGEEPKILCRNDSIQGIQGYNKKGYGGQWWEYQANLAIGALLLPRSLVRVAIEPLLTKKGLVEIEVLDQSQREEASRVLTQVFEVNPIVAKIRIETLFPAAQNIQLTL